MTLREQFEQMIDLYLRIKRQVQKLDRNFYENWKAGGFIIDETVHTDYKVLGEFIDYLSQEEDTAEQDGD